MDDGKKSVHGVIPLQPQQYRVDKVVGDGENWTANISAKLRSTSDIQSFIHGYMDITCETLKAREKSQLAVPGANMLLMNFIAVSMTHVMRERMTSLQSKPCIKKVLASKCPQI